MKVSQPQKTLEYPSRLCGESLLFAGRQQGRQGMRTNCRAERFFVIILLDVVEYNTAVGSSVYEITITQVEPDMGKSFSVSRIRFEKEQIEKLMEIKWWDWDDEKINRFAPKLCNSNMDEFIQSALSDNQEHDTCDPNTVTPIEELTHDNPM
jgi:hypothetical protein